MPPPPAATKKPRDRPVESVWKPPAGLSSDERKLEQDAAAGSRRRRSLTLSTGEVVTASMALRLYPSSRRIRAYLRWSTGGRTRERYVGEVQATTRGDNLRAAWRLAEDAGILANPELRSPAANHEIMRANRHRDTRPEIALRSALHDAGLRYRVGVRPIKQLRRTADIAFTKARVAVFVDGCFWHGCPEHHRPALRNGDAWQSKIRATIERDRETGQLLTQAGWQVLRVWEHEDVQDAARRIAEAVRSRLPR